MSGIAGNFAGRGSHLLAPYHFVGMSPRQIEEYFQLWEEKNFNKAWIETKGFRPTGAIIGEEQPIRYTAGLLQLNKVLNVYLLLQQNHLFVIPRNFQTIL